MIHSSKTNNSTFALANSRDRFPIESKYIIIFVLLYLITSIFCAVASTLVPALSSLEDPIIFEILYTCSFVGLYCYLWKKLRQSRLNPQYLIGNKFPCHRWWSLLTWVIALLLFSTGAVILLFSALSSFAPNFSEILLEEESQVSSLPIIYQCLSIINMVIVAPITEEFIFRGVLLHRLATKWNIAIAIWISSTIYGLFHFFDPIGSFFFGVVMALLYIKTKTSIVPIIAHAMYNTILLIIVQFSGTTAESSTQITSGDWIIGLLLIVVSLPFLISFIYRRFPAKNQPLPYFANEVKAMTKISD